MEIDDVLEIGILRNGPIECLDDGTIGYDEVRYAMKLLLHRQ